MAFRRFISLVFLILLSKLSFSLNKEGKNVQPPLHSIEYSISAHAIPHGGAALKHDGGSNFVPSQPRTKPARLSYGGSSFPSAWNFSQVPLKLDPFCKLPDIDIQCVSLPVLLRKLLI